MIKFASMSGKIGEADFKVGVFQEYFGKKKPAGNYANAPVNASFYDIREFFQGRSESGTMKTKSADETYNTLIKTYWRK
jgi:hypothetical protein